MVTCFPKLSLSRSSSKATLPRANDADEDKFDAVDSSSCSHASQPSRYLLLDLTERGRADNNNKAAYEQEEKEQISDMLTPRTRYTLLADSIGRCKIELSEGSVLSDREDERWKATQMVLQKPNLTSSYLPLDHADGNKNSSGEACVRREALLSKLNDSIRSVFSHVSGRGSSVSAHSRNNSIVLNASNTPSNANLANGNPTLGRSRASSRRTVTTFYQTSSIPIVSKTISPAVALASPLQLPIIASGPPRVESAEPSHSNASGKVKALLEHYRSNPAARAALQDRVKASRLLTRRKLSDRLQSNRERAASLYKAMAAHDAMRMRENERRQLQLNRKARLEEMKQQSTQKLAHQIATRPTTSHRIHGHLQNAGPMSEEKMACKRLQGEWLSWIAVIMTQVQITATLKALIIPQVIERQKAALDRSISVLLSDSFSAPLLQEKEKALGVLRERFTKYVRRWRINKRQIAAQEVAQFFSVEGIPSHYIDVLDYIVQIQKWWRKHMLVIVAEREVCWQKWQKRENYLNRVASPMIANAAPTVSSNEHVAHNGHSRPLSRSAPSSRAGRPHLLSFSSALVLEASVSKRIPTLYKLQCVSTLVAQRRANYRKVLARHTLQLITWEREHMRDLELHQTRGELGLFHEEAAPMQPSTEAMANHPKKPRRRAVPLNYELDNAIEECAKYWLLERNTILHE